MHFSSPPAPGPFAVFSAACLQVLADSDTQRTKADALYWVARHTPPNVASMRAGSAELIQMSAATLANAQRLLDLADDLDKDSSASRSPAGSSAIPSHV